MVTSDTSTPALAVSRELPWGRILTWLLFAAVVIVVLFPVGIIFRSGLVTSEPGAAVQYGFEHWRTAWSDPQIGRAVWTSISIIVVKTTIAFAIAIPTSWLIARTDIPGSRWLEFGFWAAFFMPSLAYVQAWVFMLEGGNGLINGLLQNWFGFTYGPFEIYSYWGIIWTHVMSHDSSAIIALLALGLRNMDGSLEEAARISGASKVQTILHVATPLMRPLLATILVVAVVRGLQSYEIESLLGQPAGIEVYSTLLVRLINDDPPRLAAAGALSSLIFIALIPLILLRRAYVGRREYATISGKMRPSVVELGRWRWVAFAAIFLFLMLQTLLPVLSVACGSFMVRWGYFWIENPFTLERWQTVLSSAQFLSSFGNTLILGLASGLVASLTCFAISYVVVRTRFVASGALDFISWLPFAVPGVLLSLGLLTLVLTVPALRVLHGTIFVLVIAVVLFRMPLSVQLLKSGIMQVNRELEEASAVCGASQARTHWHVLIPILMPMLVGVGMMTFVTAVNEVSGVVLLAPTNIRTLSLLSLDYLSGSATEPESAAVLTTIMILMCVVVLLVMKIFGLTIEASGSTNGK